MKILPYEAIRSAATPELIIEAVRAGLIAHAAGRMRQAITSHLEFADPPGDCHVKWGQEAGSGLFVIKVATGFYDNPRHDLPSSNGLLLLMSALTGEPLGLLEDRGWLTDARTAAAGVLALEAAGARQIGTLGVLGTGIQAAMQARWIAMRYPFDKMAVWGRRPEAAARLVADLRADGIEAAVANSPADLAAAADVIITATPSRGPLLMNKDVCDGTVVVAVGADARGKRELDLALLDRADLIICDEPAQCLDQGELQDSGIGLDRLEVLGALLALPAESRPRRASGVTVVDLTGIAAQDVAAASHCWAALQGRHA